MGYQLRRWLADRLPDDVSSGERLVALEIADQANEKTRLAYGKNLLRIVARRTGFANEKQVGHVLGKLAKRDIELRVQIIKDGKPFFDGKGRPVFAYENHETTYRIPTESDCPTLVPCPQDQGGPALAGPDAPSGPAPDAEWSRADGQEVPRPQTSGPASAGPFSSESPQENSSSLLSPAEQRIMRAVTATIEETREIISLMEEEAIKKGKPIGNLDGYISTVVANNHLPGWLARVRAARRAATPTPTPPPAADVLAAQTAHVPQPRGDDPPPSTDESIAALRARIGRAAPKTRFTAVPERVEPPEVTAARAELVRGGDFPVWMEAAYAKLGPDAPRDEAVLLAAQLARAHRTPAER